MAFTPKGLATRQRIIDEVAAFMRTDDAGDVTLDDIRSVTHTSKSQLFHYFPGGKEDLLLAVARHEAGRVLEDQQPHLGALDSWQSWDAWRIAVIARYREQGANCPLTSLMRQVGAVPGAAEIATVLLQQWQDYLHAGIVTMKDHGEVRADLDARRMAEALVVGIQGGVGVLRVTGEVEPLQTILDILLDELRGE